jgi:hypothetical protein
VKPLTRTILIGAKAMPYTVDRDKPRLPFLPPPRFRSSRHRKTLQLSESFEYSSSKPEGLLALGQLPLPGGLFCTEILYRSRFYRRKSVSPTRLELVTFGSGGRSHDSASIDDTKDLGNVQHVAVPTVVPTTLDTPGNTPSAVPTDPLFTKVTAAWDDLPEAIRAGILALVNASGGSHDA